MKRLVMATTLFLALAAVPGAVPYNVTDRTFSAYAVGPSLDDLFVRDGRASYQWIPKNDDQTQKVVQELNIDSLDPAYIRGNRRGEVDTMALPPLGPVNILTSTINAAPGIGINIQPTWQVYSQIGLKRPLTVAAIDTGVDISHPDLQGSIWADENEVPGDGTNNDSSGSVDDVNGWSFYSSTNQIYEDSEDTRGIHAADIIAVFKGSDGIVRIIDNNYVKIVPVKTLGGENGKGSPESVTAAIKHMKANGAQICNLGFGPQNCTGGLKAAIHGSGMLFIATAGSGGDSVIGYNIGTSSIYPASLPSDNVITVANLMFDDTLDASPNFGAAGVDIAAPGTFILSTIPDNGYTFMDGAPTAVLMVTGVATMLYISRPGLGLPDIKNVILASAHKTGDLNGKVLCGRAVGTNRVMY